MTQQIRLHTREREKHGNRKKKIFERVLKLIEATAEIDARDV